MDCLLALVCVGLLVAIAVGIISTRNRLVPQRERIKAARARILSSCQRRDAVVTDILAVALHYEKYEGEIIKEVSRNARLRGEEGGSPASLIVSNLGNYYPQLRASETYQSLITQLGLLEGGIHQDLAEYNSAAARYNSELDLFPATVVVRLMAGFQSVEYLDSSVDQTLLSAGAVKERLRGIGPRSLERER